MKSILIIIVIIILCLSFWKTCDQNDKRWKQEKEQREERHKIKEDRRKLMGWKEVN